MIPYARLSSLLILLACLPTFAEEAKPDVKSYMRVIDVDDNTIRLDMAFRVFAPADGKGPTIILGGAIHIADESFYELAQQTLDAQDLVLFEGVGGGHEKAVETPESKAVKTREHIRGVAAAIERLKTKNKEYPANLAALVKSVEPSRIKKSRVERAIVDGWGRPLVYAKTEEGFTLLSRGADGKPGGEALDADLAYADQPALTKAEINDKGGLQGDLADALGLTFQLHAYDTSKKNYRNSDMQLTQVQDRAKAGGGDADVLVSMMSGSGLMGGVVKVALGLIKASPKMQGTMKVMMMDMLQQVGDDMTKLKQVPANMQALMKVLIDERNQIVVNDLKKEIAKAGAAGAPTSIGVWYGAGHMKDLESRVVLQLGYKPVANFWLPAITTDIRAFGMTKEELATTRAMLQRMMSQMK